MYNISNYSSKYNKTNSNFRKEENCKVQIQIEPNMSLYKPKKTKVQLFNYNYPISNESCSLDLCQSLISKQKTKLSTQFLSISKNNNNNNNNNNNSKFLNNFENNKDTKGINEATNSDINKNVNISTTNKLNNANSFVNINNKAKKKKRLLKIKKSNYSSSI